jgi:predicted Zn-dependent peptidase
MWQVQVGTLSNGMKLYCHPGPANVAGIGFKAGSIYDPQGMVGMAHFTEHLVCQQSTLYDPRAVTLLSRQYMGGPDEDINIRTDRTSVFFGHADLLRRHHLEKMFDVHASFVHPKTRVIDPRTTVPNERRAVHQEYYLRGLDVMESLLYDLVYQTMYEKNPIRNRIDCEIEDLKRITLKDVERFLRRYYVPRNAFAIVLGPKVEVAQAMAERYFRDWEGKRVPALDYDHSDDFPQLSSVRSCEIERTGIHQFHGSIGFPTETDGTPDAAVIDAITHILEVRLGWALRDESYRFDLDSGTYRTPVYAERSFVHGAIWASFATVSESFAKYAEDIILAECGKLKNDLVQVDELKAAIGAVERGYLDAFWNTPATLSEFIIDAVTNGDDDLVGMHAYRGKIYKVTRKKIREVANKYFTKNYVRVLIKPA